MKVWKQSPLLERAEEFLEDPGFSHPRRTGEDQDGHGEGQILLRLKAEFDLLGEDLSCRQGYDLTVILLDLRVLQHGELVGTPGSRGGDFIHIAIVFDEFL